MFVLWVAPRKKVDRMKFSLLLILYLVTLVGGSLSVISGIMLYIQWHFPQLLEKAIPDRFFYGLLILAIAGTIHSIAKKEIKNV